MIEEALEHARYFADMFGHMDLGMMLVDRRNRIWWTNENIKTILSCSQLKSNISPSSPIDVDRSCCIDCPVLQACSNPHRHQHYCVREHQQLDSGKQSTYHIITTPVPSDKELFFITIRDITEREATFREKSELQMALSNVLDNTVDAVITLDLQGRIHSWNRGAWQVFGYSKAEVKGEYLGLLFPDDMESEEKYNEIKKLLVEKGFVRNHRARMMTKEKRQINVAVTQTAMHNSAGEPFGHSLIIRDISKVVHLEQLLSHKVIQLTKLLQMDDIIRGARTLEEIYNVILVAVTAGEGLRFNRAFLLMVNSSTKRIKGRQAIGPSSPEEAHAIYSRHFEESPTLSEIIRQHLDAGHAIDPTINDQVRKIQIPLDDKTNPLVRCLYENRPFLFIRGGVEDHHLESILNHIETDQFVAMPLVWQNQRLGIIIADNYITRRDITMEDIQFLSSFASRAASGISSIQLQDDLHTKVMELQNAYQEMTRLQKDSLRQERLVALGEMAGKVAHEIRNPLSSIGGFARLLQKLDPAKEHLKYLDIISDETSRLEGILDGILGYVKSPVDVMKLEDLNGLLLECRTLLQQQALDHDVVFVMNLDDSLPMVPCDSNQLKQAIINIMNNALDAIGRDGTLEVSSGKEEDFAVISIADDGIGIEEKDKSKLFETFFSTKSRGVGLGLNITRQIIHQHSGDIMVESEANKGTAFTIKIPIKLKEVTHDGLAEEETPDR